MASSIAQVRAIPVAIRNITQEFLVLRSQYKQRRGGSSRTDSLEDPLNPVDLTLKTLPPVWVETVNAVKVDLSLIREKGATAAGLLHFFIFSPTLGVFVLMAVSP